MAAQAEWPRLHLDDVADPSNGTNFLAGHVADGHPRRDLTRQILVTLQHTYLLCVLQRPARMFVRLQFRTCGPDPQWAATRHGLQTRGIAVGVASRRHSRCTALIRAQAG